MNEEKMIPVTEAVRNIHIMTDRLASLYYHTVTVLADELGDDKAEALVKKIIKAYGDEAGEKAKQTVTQMGLAADVEHYAKASDLPAYGWEKERVTPEGERATIGRVSYCPLAEYWKERDFAKWGRLYCHVDQAKYIAFNGEITCYHDQNVLDGDEICIVRAVQK